MGKIIVPRDDRIFDELGNNTYSPEDLLSELIDNSLSARDGKMVHIDLNFYLDEENKSLTEFSIKDDAKGIPLENFGIVICPGGSRTSDPLNEHGLGLKQSVAAMGHLIYLASKTENSNEGHLIRKFGYEVDEESTDIIPNHGTEVRVAIDENKKMKTKGYSWFKNECRKKLGARYRRFLQPDNRFAVIMMHFYDSNRNRLADVEVEKNEPVYFHPSKAKNEPVFSNFKLKGHNWEAKLTFGYAPTKEEYERLGMEPVSRYDVYGVTLNHQGLDIIINNRVLLFHQLYQQGIVDAQHNSFNHVRGEIELLKGFTTTVTKNQLNDTVAVKECMEQIRNILSGEAPGPGGVIKDYLKTESTPEDLPEDLLRDRLKNHLEKMPLYDCETVETEHVVEDLGGFIDVYAQMKDGSYEIWELKNEEARALDVFQLFMYMTVKKEDVQVKRGFILATSFSNGAKFAVEFLNKKYGFNIIKTTYQDYPINYKPTPDELKEYF